MPAALWQPYGLKSKDLTHRRKDIEVHGGKDEKQQNKKGKRTTRFYLIDCPTYVFLYSCSVNLRVSESPCEAFNL